MKQGLPGVYHLTDAVSRPNTLQMCRRGKSLCPRFVAIESDSHTLAAQLRHSVWTLKQGSESILPSSLPVRRKLYFGP